jgi:FAD/FMN-containing dehydrogenase
MAINAGRTMSDAHGVGNRTVKHLMRKELGAALVAMNKIKEALDPNDIMNPGIMPT